MPILLIFYCSLVNSIFIMSPLSYKLPYFFIFYLLLYTPFEPYT